MAKKKEENSEETEKIEASQTEEPKDDEQKATEEKAVEQEQDEVVEQKAESAVQESPPPIPARTRTRIRPFEWLGNLARIILLLVLVVFLGAGVGIAAFLLVPRAIQTFVQPTDDNSERIAELEETLTRMEEEQSDILQSQQQLLEEQEAHLLEVEAMLLEQVSELEVQAETLDEFEGMLGSFDGSIEERLEALEALQEQVDTLENELPGSEEFASLNHGLTLMTGWQELLRARVRLVQNNPGEALNDVELAQRTLLEVYEQASEEQQTALDPILTRLELVIANIDDNPFAATEDLEVAWRDLDRLIADSFGLDATEVEDADADADAQ